ncbi:hypothetical protein [Flavobacterium seoulense]|uniref:Uncharacterized protein n=1 Tax=Flavobacterium seoulense TaxID=1492738 RepID=A0A066WPU1_9FLAO|nr:hypothetical protein [Flavobacterium seoulense]KDN56077.1 hypothetical protein FEM21_06290 [Flavobacterium seoulense]
MKGILKEKNEIEKLQNEFKIFTTIKPKETATTKKKKEELVLEECEL